MSTSAIVLDTEAIQKRVGTSDWFFNVDTEGKLVILIRRRNVLEVLDAAQFQKTFGSETENLHEKKEK